MTQQHNTMRSTAQMLNKACLCVKICSFSLLTLGLTGCIYKVVTVPVGIAYKTTKVAVKGTAMVVGAVIPDGDDADDKTHQAQANKDQANKD